MQSMSPAPAVDPEILASLDQGAATLQGLTLDQLPQLRANLVTASRAATKSEDVERFDVVVPGAAGQPAVTMRVHRPIGIQEPMACLFAIHGGGYVLGTYEVEDQRLDAWCRNLTAVGVSVEYRLAPETRYPGALDDCYAGLRWVFDHAEEIGVDPSRIGTLGTSAGGGLAIAAALRARDLGGEFSPAFQLLSYPMIDDRQTSPSSRWDDVPVWDRASNDFAWQCYLGELHRTPDVPGYAAPARVSDLNGLPATFLSVGTADVVCDETIDFARRLLHCGVATDLRVYAGAPHGLDRRATHTNVSRTSRRDMLTWLARQTGMSRR
jgi:acetyl esterase/lipase